MTISGKIVKGSGLSAKKGFHTANINLRQKLPKFVSLAIAEIDQKTYPGILIVGAPTKHIRKYPKIEFYCLNIKGNFYGKRIVIKLLKKIRSTKKFDSQTDLIKQTKKDIKQAKQYFKNNG